MHARYPQSYPAKYHDENGCVITSFRNDGRELRMAVRGVEFAGRDFDALEPTTSDPSDLASFTLQQNCLCSCRLEWQVQVPIFVEGQLAEGALSAKLLLGAPHSNGGIDCEELALKLEFPGGASETRRAHGWFSEALEDLQSTLPAGVFLLCCFNCALSHYSPAGYGFFGWLGCFRDRKDLARAAWSKGEVFSLYTSHLTELVQETHFCPEFEQRYLGVPKA